MSDIICYNDFSTVTAERIIFLLFKLQCPRLAANGPAGQAFRLHWGLLQSFMQGSVRVRAAAMTGASPSPRCDGRETWVLSSRLASHRAVAATRPTRWRRRSPCASAVQKIPELVSWVVQDRDHSHASICFLRGSSRRTYTLSPCASSSGCSPSSGGCSIFGCSTSSRLG